MCLQQAQSDMGPGAARACILRPERYARAFTCLRVGDSVREPLAMHKQGRWTA
jgi:hypothetical protein